MRKLILLLIGLLPLMASGQSAHMSFEVKVINDAGEPMPYCGVVIRTFDRWVPGTGFGKDFFNIRKLETNEEGIVQGSAKSKANYLYYAAISPDGYYDTVQTRYEYTHQEDGKWQPENQKFEVVLKRIKNPIPMYAKEVGPVRRLAIPVLGKEVGFDLMEADWVAPYGSGRVSDVIFKMENRFVSVYDFDCSLTISFSNQGDGLIGVKKPLHQGSRLRLDYWAPFDGYRPMLERKAFAHSNVEPITVGFDREQNYYFRVRTVLDENGEIESAHYGKIYGDFEFSPYEEISFRYYLNPTPNDRNLEFDPERNLFPGEDINEP